MISIRKLRRFDMAKKNNTKTVYRRDKQARVIPLKTAKKVKKGK
jgi:hypothetical protein